MSPEIFIGLALSLLLIVFFGESSNSKKPKINARSIIQKWMRELRGLQSIHALEKEALETRKKILEAQNKILTENHIEDFTGTEKSAEISREKAVNQLAITELLLAKEYQDIIKATYIYCFFVIISRLLFILLNQNFSYLFILPFFPISLFYIRIKVLEFRIKNGIYGFNAHEAKEIINFISKNADHWEGPGGGSKTKVFLEPPVERDTNEKWVPDGRVDA